MTQHEYASLRLALRTVASTTKEYRQSRPAESPGRRAPDPRYADIDAVAEACAAIVAEGDRLTIPAIARRLFRKDPGRVREIVGHLRKNGRFPWALECERKERAS